MWSEISQNVNQVFCIVNCCNKLLKWKQAIHRLCFLTGPHVAAQAAGEGTKTCRGRHCKEPTGSEKNIARLRKWYTFEYFDNKYFNLFSDSRNSKHVLLEVEVIQKCYSQFACQLKCVTYVLVQQLYSAANLRLFTNIDEEVPFSEDDSFVNKIVHN